MDKKAPGLLTPLEFAEMMEDFSEAGEWMSKQLRSKSNKGTDRIDDDQDRLDSIED